MSAHLRLSLQVTSIQSTLMPAQSVAHALMFVLTRQYHSHKKTNFYSPLKDENHKSSHAGSFFCIVSTHSGLGSPPLMGIYKVYCIAIML